jgi:regulatory protein
LELRRKRIADDIIERVVGNDMRDEIAALTALVTRKRRQTKYQEDQKLLAYLARQGFSYDDIRTVLDKA